MDELVANGELLVPKVVAEVVTQAVLVKHYNLVLKLLGDVVLRVPLLANLEVLGLRLDSL